jgi:hypothetical protein
MTIKKEKEEFVTLAFSFRGGETLNAVVPKFNYFDIMKTLNNGGTSTIQVIDINKSIGTIYIPRNNLLFVQVWLPDMK